jgi:prefoldin subunit 5
MFVVAVKLDTLTRKMNLTKHLMVKVGETKHLVVKVGETKHLVVKVGETYSQGYQARSVEN